MEGKKVRYECPAGHTNVTDPVRRGGEILTMQCPEDGCMNIATPQGYADE